MRAVIFDMYETLVTLWHSKPYFGREMAEEIGIPEAVFREIWDPSEDDRTCGRRDFEAVIEEILRRNNKFSKGLYESIVSKRNASKVEAFNYLEPGLIPMLEELKARGIKIALITNCYKEEKIAIEDSVLYKYFDVVCMSCVEGIKKPDQRIFQLCLNRLQLNPEECIYCGDGGSHELEVAKTMNMKPVQALWYLKEGTKQPVGRLQEYIGAKKPGDLIDLLGK